MHRSHTQQEEEAIAYQLAKNHEKQTNYSNVIQILEPYYHREAKTHNILIIRLLAEAYMYKALESTEYLERALPLWKILRENSRNQLNPNPEDAVKILVSLTICIGNKPDIRELLTQEALKVVADNEKAFLFIGRNHQLDDSNLKGLRYSICLSAAIYNATYGSLQIDLKLQIEAFDRARKYFIAALNEKPKDLKALLNYAKFIVVASQNNAQLAIDLLLPHAAIYAKTPCFNFALKQLYSMINMFEHAQEYEKRYRASSQPETKEPQNELTTLFSNPVRLKTLDKCTPPEKLQTAKLMANEKKYTEAKEIIVALLSEHPDYLPALETLAAYEASSIAKGDPQKAFELCDRILALNKKSITGLLLKGNLLLKSATSTDNDMLEAVTLFENAFECGCRDLSMINKLLVYSIAYQDYERIIIYSSEKASREPRTILHFYIAYSHFQLDRFQEAYEAFLKVRALDKYFEHNLISLYLIKCLFHLAETIDDYEVCAKKISSYLARTKSKENKADIDNMLERLTKLNIHVHQGERHSNSTDTAPKTSTLSAPEQNCQIPDYVKTYIKGWIEKHSLQCENNLSLISDTSTEIEEKEEALYPIGDPELHLYGYISKKDKMPMELLKNYERTLKNGHLLSIHAKTKEGSNDTGIEKLHNGRWAIKINSDYRLLSTGTFFRKRTDDPNKHKTIIRFEKIKPHSRMNR